MFAMEIENLKGVDNAVIDEELLTHHVQQFSVLYDKSHKDFHRKDIKRNAPFLRLLRLLIIMIATASKYRMLTRAMFVDQ